MNTVTAETASPRTARGPGPGGRPEYWDEAVLEFPRGRMEVLVGGAGGSVVGVRFGNASGNEHWLGSAPRDGAALAGAVAELAEYAAGDRKEFEFPIHLAGTAFQISVWKELLDIPYGSTSTYGAVAAAIGRPGAARAVGAAIGSNPVGIVVPCHRVIGANGTLTGFGGGLANKTLLLAREGVTL